VKTSWPLQCCSRQFSLAITDNEPVHSATTTKSQGFLFQDIHGFLVDGLTKQEKTVELLGNSGESLSQISKYYFDGKGKAIRIRLGLTMAEAVNHHFFLQPCKGASNNTLERLARNQRCLALVAEMFHTASLMHDDVIDKSEARRSRESVNAIWGQRRSIISGDYVVAIAQKIVALTRDDDAVLAMSTILNDLVIGEFQQMAKTKDNKTDRFQMYIDKTYNKTASLMSNSCKAVAVVARNKAQDLAAAGSGERHLLLECDDINAVPESAFQYGRNVGIAFQLIDDWLDFSSNAKLLGKPAAADLKLGLATAPVLFAAEKYPELEPMIKRRFCQPGDVEHAFDCVLNSNGLEDTKALAQQYCKEALENIKTWRSSDAKSELEGLVNDVVERMT